MVPLEFHYKRTGLVLLRHRSEKQMSLKGRARSAYWKGTLCSRKRVSPLGAVSWLKQQIQDFVKLWGRKTSSQQRGTMRLISDPLQLPMSENDEQILQDSKKKEFDFLNCHIKAIYCWHITLKDRYLQTWKKTHAVKYNFHNPFLKRISNRGNQPTKRWIKYRI